MSVNKVQLANGETIIDISDSTVTPETLAEGVTAHDASGQKITGKMVPGGGSFVQSDWNQNDSSAADFIKNKPFGYIAAVLFEQEITTWDEGSASISLTTAPNVGDVVTIEWNGTAYDCTVSDFEGYLLIGNCAMLGLEDTGEPFMIMLAQSIGQVFPVDGTTGSVSVKITGLALSKLSNKYFNSYIPLYLDVMDGSHTYIYADAGLTQKVTTAELYEIEKLAPIVLFESAWGVVQNGVVYPYETNTMNSIAYIKSSAGTHYTAEYTET